MDEQEYDLLEKEFEGMCRDIEADTGEEAEWHDVVVSACWGDWSVEVQRELCRTKLGHIPHELESRLGKTDWLNS